MSKQIDVIRQILGKCVKSWSVKTGVDGDYVYELTLEFDDHTHLVVRAWGNDGNPAKLTVELRPIRRNKEERDGRADKRRLGAD